MQPTPCICHMHNLHIWSLHPKAHFHKLVRSHSRVHQPGMFSQLVHSVCTLCHMSTLLHHQRRCLPRCPHDHYWGCQADHKRLLQKMFGWLSVVHASTASLFTTKQIQISSTIVANFSVLFYFCRVYLKGASVSGLNVHNWLSISGLEVNMLAMYKHLYRNVERSGCRLRHRLCCSCMPFVGTHHFQQNLVYV